MAIKHLGQQSAVLTSDLLAAAHAGRVTYAKPKTAKEICKRYEELHGWELTDADIRTLVNYARCYGHKIGSSTQGYWHIVDGDGEEHVANQLESRMIGIIQAYAGMWKDRVPGLLERLRIQAGRKPE